MLKNKGAFSELVFMRKVRKFAWKNGFSKKNTYKGNLVWVLIHIFVSINIFSLSPFFTQWKKTGDFIQVSKLKNLNEQDLLIVDLIEEEPHQAVNLVNRELDQLKAVQYAGKNAKYLLSNTNLFISLHRVRGKENLWTISKKYGIDPSTIISFNNLDRNVLSKGQLLKIPNKKGILHKLRKGESLWAVSKKYNLSIPTILRANYIFNPYKIRAGEAIFLPGAILERSFKSLNKPFKDRLKELPFGFIRPVVGKIVSGFGFRLHPIFGRIIAHKGVDFSTPYGTKIKAAMSGRVVYSGWFFGYGKMIELVHDKGYVTRYAHNSRNLVKKGDYVEKGQGIALSGSSGISTGPHLHFEIHKHGTIKNPAQYLR